MNLDSMDIACNLVEITYIKNMTEKLKLFNLDDFQIRKILFPDEWYYVSDKELKLRILREALTKNIVISDTEGMINYYKQL